MSSVVFFDPEGLVFCIAVSSFFLRSELTPLDYLQI